LAEFGRQRTANGLTYYQLAKLAGQEQIGVQRVLDGAEMPSLARVVGIAAALGKSLAIVGLTTRKQRTA
jgi:transcriptional regulator with XRE-family HTH domain